MTAQASGSLDPQGPSAGVIAELWWLMLGLGIAVFVVFAVALAFALFRRRDAGDRGRDEPPGDADSDDRGDPRFGIRRWIALGGVAMPLAVLLVVYGATLGTMRALPTNAADDALVVEVVGHQWWWEVHYPDQGITTANELHLPVGRQVEFQLTSQDVIHSFWVPPLGGKMDLLPDGTNTLVLQADQPGEHRTQCSEFCGLQHSRMGLLVVAEPAEAFDAWVAHQQQPAADPPTATARRGEEVFADAGCAACHAVRGTALNGTTAGTTDAVLGPDLTHVASRSDLAAGVLPNTPENLRRWLTDQESVKSGVSMPVTELPDDDIDALVDYLAALE